MQLLTVQVATLSILWSRFLTYQLAILLTSSSLSVSGICSAADKNMSFYILSIKTCLFLLYQLLPMMQLLTVQVATLSILWSRFSTYQLAILLTSSSLSVSGICSAADKNMYFYILSIKTCLFLFYQLLPMIHLLSVQVASLSIIWSRFLTYQLAILLTAVVFLFLVYAVQPIK